MKENINIDIYDVNFIINDSKIDLNKKSQLFNSMNLKLYAKNSNIPKVEFFKHIIEKQKKCFEFCKNINDYISRNKTLYYFTYYNNRYTDLESIIDLIINECEFRYSDEIPYLFSYKDIEYLKRHIENKEKRIKKYETENNNSIKNKIQIWRTNFL